MPKAAQRLAAIRFSGDEEGGLGMRIDVILEGIAVLGCVAIVHATPAEGQTITKSFEVAPGGRLLLETDRGAIDVRPTDTLTRLEVAVRNATGIAVEFTQRGPDVQIHGKATRGFWHWSWWKFWRSPQFVVTVPRQYNIDLSTSGGAISVGDLEGEVRSRTSQTPPTHPFPLWEVNWTGFLARQAGKKDCFFRD
jgi:hypothetical protein